MMKGNAESADTRYIQMTQTPVEKLIPRMALPSIVSMLVTSIYNMADTYFVSQLDTNASAAVGVIFALMSFIQAIGFMFGMGSGNLVSKLLGQKKNSEAERVVSVIFFTSVGCGLVILTAGTVFLEQMVVLLGAIDPFVREYAKDYAQYILLGAPLMMGSYVLNNQLRAQGSSAKSMIGISFGGVLNVVLDPIFIFVFDMGIAGAAIATVISQAISFAILICLTEMSPDVISVSIRRFRPTFGIYLQVIHIGIPSFCRQGMASLSSVILNRATASFGPEVLAAMSIVNRIMQFVYSSLIGFAQGFQPVSGFNFGAKRYDRVLAAYRFSLKVALVLLSALGIVAIILAPDILTLFRRDDPAVIEVGTLALRLQCLTLPLQALIIMSQFLTQSIGYGLRASLIAMARHGIFLIPFYEILPRFIGVLGIQLGQPLSDLCTMTMAVIIAVSVVRTLRAEAEKMASPDGSAEQ